MNRNSAVGRRVAAAALFAALGLSAPAAWSYEVRFEGSLDEDLRKTLEGGSLLFEQAGAETPPDTREIVASAQADYRRLLAVLYDRGYFGPSIRIALDGQEAATILAVTPPSTISTAVITIDPGRQFRFGRVEAAPLAPGTVLPKEFATGETAGVAAIEAAGRTAIRGWRDAGHAKAEVSSQQITARHQDARLDARLAIAPGPRLRFGALEIEGDSAVRRERILEIAGLPEGEVFSPAELEDASSRLRRTGAFRSVAIIEGDVTRGSDILPVELRVADNPPRRFGFGAELATIEGVTLTGFWLHRNLFGGAESLRFDAEIGGLGGTSGGVGGGSSGGEDFRLATRFERPATFTPDTDFYASAEIAQEDEPNYFSRQGTVETGFDWIETDQRSYSLGVGLRRATTEDAFGRDDYTLLLLPASATLDYRDNDLNARSGYYAGAEVTPFLALSGSDNGLLSEVDLRTYLTFGGDNGPTLALRAQLGSVVGPSLADAPADFLFYSGGGGTVRGQEYQSLGVRIGPEEDDVVGGRSFLGLSAELRLRTSGALGYVGFVDAGFIGRNAFPDSAGDWHSGAGLGIRYATPIGPLRFDLAVPVSGDDGGQSFQLYFGIGHSF